eukprot:2889661-Pyramimonas_sp.AAC.1
MAPRRLASLALGLQCSSFSLHSCSLAAAAAMLPQSTYYGFNFRSAQGGPVCAVPRLVPWGFACVNIGGRLGLGGYVHTAC